MRKKGHYNPFVAKKIKDKKKKFFSLEKNNFETMFVYLVRKLQEILPKENEELLSFKVDYIKKNIFHRNDDEEMMHEYQISNEINYLGGYPNDIYLRLIKDILDFYDIDKKVLTLHYVGRDEPLEMLIKLEEYRKDDFYKFLIKEQKLDKKEANNIVQLILTFSKMMKNRKDAYSSFFHLDNVMTCSVFRTLIYVDFMKLTKWNKRQISKAKTALYNIEAYYQYVASKAFRHNDKLLYKFKGQHFC